MVGSRRVFAVLVVAVMFCLCGAQRVAAQVGGWNGFGVGSWVKIKTVSVTEAAGQKMRTEAELKQTLKSIDHGLATIEIETNTTTIVNGIETKQAPLVRSAQIPYVPPSPPPKPGEETPDPIPTPPPPLGQIEETLMVAGKPIVCTKMTSKSSDETGKMESTSWYSPEVPGGLVKAISLNEGQARMESTTELLEFEVVK